MGRKEVLAKRKELEDYYYSCKLKTPGEVSKLFEAYTYLIWTHHQAGLVYDYYNDQTTINHEGTFKEVGGEYVTTMHTIVALAASPASNMKFYDIFCVGNEEEGYRFGQIESSSGVVPQGAVTAAGLGSGLSFQRGENNVFCQCTVKKVNGRWAITREHVLKGNEVGRQRGLHARPFIKNILELYQKPQDAEADGGQADGQDTGNISEEA